MRRETQDGRRNPCPESDPPCPRREKKPDKAGNLFGLRPAGSTEHAVDMIWKGRRVMVFVTDRCLFLNVNHYFSFLYVLFLMRVRKRTKKKRALRQGAGFSVNHPGGINGNSAAYQSFSSADANALDGSARKNPPYPRSPRGGETGEGRREKKPSPGMLFLLASGTRRNPTRQAISPLSRLTSTRFLGGRGERSAGPGGLALISPFAFSAFPFVPFVASCLRVRPIFVVCSLFPLGERAGGERSAGPVRGAAFVLRF